MLTALALSLTLGAISTPTAPADIIFSSPEILAAQWQDDHTLTIALAATHPRLGALREGYHVRILGADNGEVLARDYVAPRQRFVRVSGVSDIQAVRIVIER
ncbi:hypothetical protein [Woodsholea maritima]|uniref:hypothetical protein n=1 Tax=Woodsholea maritima TaxID=240237 RepID=UPI00036F5252|nr:hypothetical protein [Woodsholea maritima]